MIFDFQNKLADNLPEKHALCEKECARLEKILELDTIFDIYKINKSLIKYVRTEVVEVPSIRL